jgi:uncharacterized protein YjbJ (UPF0337 family)
VEAVKGSYQGKWADLTDDEIGQAQANNERFIGAIQERYGIAKDEAERQFYELRRKLS